MSVGILKNWWIIEIGGYGTFAFKGSELAAEEMRVHKARWEGAVGRKRPAVAGDAKDAALIAYESEANREKGKRGSAWRLG